MASTTWSASFGNDQSLNNSSGFNALPVGYGDCDAAFAGVTSFTSFWTSTSSFGGRAYSRYLISNNVSLGASNEIAQDGLSVRFVRD